MTRTEATITILIYGNSNKQRMKAPSISITEFLIIQLCRRYLVVNSFHKNGVNIKRGAIVDKLFAFEIFEHIFEVFSPCAAKRVLGYFCRNGETSASAIQARMPITNKESA